MDIQSRAFLFDPDQWEENRFIAQIFSAWDMGHSVNIIPPYTSTALRDEAIIRCDPTHIITSDEAVFERENAIVQTPELAAVVLTSGTTNAPKPVELSFSSMHSSVDALYRTMGLDDDANWLCCLPPYYIAGLAIFARSWARRSRLIFHSSFNIERIEQEIQQKNVNVVSLVAPQLRALIDRGVDLSHLYSVLVGGSSVDNELLEKCDDLDISVHTTYGLTETWGGVCHDGIVFDNTDVRINEDDIVEIKSGSLFSSYRHNAMATEQAFTSDGYFITKDRGSWANDLLTIWGRNDDVINSGGVKIDPLIVEKLFNKAYPHWEGYIGSTEHSVYGQCTTLFVLEADVSLEDVRKELSVSLPSTHLPIRVAKVPSFPLTESGKLKRKSLSNNAEILEQHPA